MAHEKEPYKHQYVVDAVVTKLNELPEGTEVSTSQVLEMLYGKWNFTEREYDYGEVAFSFEEYFDVHYQIQKQAKKAGLLLDNSPWDGMATGLPFHCPFIVRRKGGKTMMISPDAFYEREIKGKDQATILRVINRLKREIAKLKHTMEHPDYDTEVIKHPSEYTQLRCTRLYLERAKLALAEEGTPYEPTAVELRVMDFNANIGNISRIALNINGFFSGNFTYTIRLDEKLHLWIEDMLIPTPSNFDIPADYPMTKEEFLDRFAELHVGEWRKYYNPERFGYVILDGTQWELKIEYSNGRKAFTSGGSNSYPYNFKKLTELFGIEEADEIVEDEVIQD